MNAPVTPANAARAASAVKPVRAARRNSGGITLRDVAHLAGVSVITASRALNTPDKVSPAAQQRVREAVERTGYVPNLLAGGLASNRSRLVAVVVPTIAGSVFLEAIQALTDELAHEGFQVMLGQSGYADASGASREDELLEAIVGRRPDAIVLTGILHSETGRRRLTASGIPVVETWDLTTTPIDMLVGFSHAAVGAAVAEFLYRKGYRRPAIVTADDQRAGQRHESFVARLAQLGLPAPLAQVMRAPSTLGNGRAALQSLLSAKVPPDAIFCSSDVLAQGVLIEAGARGLSIGPELADRRLGLIGFGDLAFAAELHPALTTVRIDGTAIGFRAARLIVERLRAGNTSFPASRIHDLGFSIVERASA